TTNAAVFLVGMSLCDICWRMARPVMPPTAAALATLLFLVLVMGMTLNTTHHMFSALVAFAAILVLLPEKSTARTAVAGVLLAAATWFTQTRGPVVAISVSVWLLVERFRRAEPWTSFWRLERALLLSMGLTYAALASYYLSSVGFEQLWFFQ